MKERKEKIALLLVQAQCSPLCGQQVSFLALGFTSIQCAVFLGFSPSHLEANYSFCLLFQEVLHYHLFFLFWKFILWCKSKSFADIKCSFSSFTTGLMFCSWGELSHFWCRYHASVYGSWCLLPILWSSSGILNLAAAMPHHGKALLVGERGAYFNFRECNQFLTLPTCLLSMY